MAQPPGIRICASTSRIAVGGPPGNLPHPEHCGCPVGRRCRRERHSCVYYSGQGWHRGDDVYHLLPFDVREGAGGLPQFVSALLAAVGDLAPRRLVVLSSSQSNQPSYVRSDGTMNIFTSAGAFPCRWVVRPPDPDRSGVQAGPDQTV